jgi:hypothetical protein
MEKNGEVSHTFAMSEFLPPLSRVSDATVNAFLAPCLRRSRWRIYGLQGAVFIAALLCSLLADAADCNALVLAQVQAMPAGGRYAANATALARFAQAVEVRDGAICVKPAGTAPNFCSEATYLVFLKTIAGIRFRPQLEPAVLKALCVVRQADGHGVWGRWNANGPGTARLFYELGLGRNFEDFAQARPGDFMKIFWTREVGCRERGHSVIYLGSELRGGVEVVRFWSSNLPGGYGEKAVPRTKIAYAVFSRLEHPEALARLPGLADADRYLSQLGSEPSSVSEVRTLTGM